MDSSTFHLRYAPDQKLNIRLIENTDIKNILRGNVRDLLAVMNDLAYVDIESDEYIQANPDALKLYKLAQFGLQYMMFTVSKLGDNVLLLKDYIKIQEDKRAKLEELIRSQEETIHRLKKKKRTMLETEKHYAGLLRALQIEGHTGSSKENTPINRNVNYESEPEKKTKANIPKRSPITKKNQGQGLEDGRPPLRTPSDRQTSATGNTQETLPTEPKDPMILLKEKFDQLPMNEKQEFRKFVIQESFGKGPGLPDLGLGDLPAAENKKETKEEKTLPKLQTTEPQKDTFKMQPSNQSAIKVEDNEKEEGEVDEDEYEDDFELSESAKMSRVIINKSEIQQEKRNPEDTLSIDSKEFNESYLNLEAMKNNLETIKNKAKATVEFDIKGFKNP